MDYIGEPIQRHTTKTKLQLKEFFHFGIVDIELVFQRMITTCTKANGFLLIRNQWFIPSSLGIGKTLLKANSDADGNIPVRAYLDRVKWELF